MKLNFILMIKYSCVTKRKKTESNQFMHNILEYLNSSKLKGTSKKIADYCLDHTESFLEHDANTLGKLTNTSAASIIRFCKQLGFKGLTDFRLKLAKTTGRVEDKIDPLVTSSDEPKDILQKLLINSRQNTELTASSIKLDALNQAVKIIKKADQIIIGGVAASGLAAMDLYYKFIRAGRKTFFSQDAHIALERISSSTKKDVAIMFSYSGLTKEIILGAKTAKKNCTPVIAITRNETSPLSKIADIVIALPTKEKLLRVGAIDSLFSEIFISSLLYLATVNKDLDYLEKEMRDTEALTTQLKVGE